MDTDAAARHRSGLWAILSVALPRLKNGASHAPLTNREDSTREKQLSNAHISYEHAGLAEWGVRVTHAELFRPLPFEQSGIRAAHQGQDAPVRRHPFRRLNLDSSTPKILGILNREFPQGDRIPAPEPIF